MANNYENDGWIAGQVTTERERAPYVAYGSNLNVAQMTRRCPTAKLLGPTAIHGWRLVFRGCADVTRAPGGSVPGGLWSIGPQDEAALDRYEGYPDYYGKRWVRVRFADGRYGRAMVYVMRGSPAMAAPSPGYLETIRDGYADFGLDPGLLLDAVVATMRAEAAQSDLEARLPRRRREVAPPLPFDRTAKRTFGEEW
jgi:gamma-glutamylcyclotransferase (GGCT)/AIG2-like uncharacterized protein YtfP